MALRVNEVLTTLVSHTLGGTIAIGAMSLLTWLSRKRTGARWRSLAWLVLCLRLALPLPLTPALEGWIRSPIRIPVPDSFVLSGPSASGGGPAKESQNAGNADGREGSSGVQGSHSGPAFEGGTAGAEVSGSRPAQGEAPSPEGPEFSWQQALWILWLAGVGVEVAWLAFAHLRFLAWLRRWGNPAEDPDLLCACGEAERELGLTRRVRVLLCSGLPSPMLAGIVRPVLLLPEEAAPGSALRYTLLHELTHFRRRDLLRKALALWVRTLHWFNPAFRYMVRMVERDTELACDEAVLARLPREEYRAYGLTILEAAERNAQPST